MEANSPSPFHEAQQADTQDNAQPIPIVDLSNNLTIPSSEAQPAEKTDSVTPLLVIEESPVQKNAAMTKILNPPSRRVSTVQWRALSGIILLCIVLSHAISAGGTQFIGPQGWAYVLSGPANTANANLLADINERLQHPQAARGPARTQITPQQYIALIVHSMTLDQKLGQMMIVQFLGSSYSLPLSTMVSQYNVGAVLIFSINGNIVGRDQLKGLVQQIKGASHSIPPGLAIDQEGGYVNRLQNLDGPRPAAATLGATDDTTKALAAGRQDAQDLLSYGMNINLAPVVDVDNTFDSELHLDQRTFGRDPATVTKMAGAYLQGLQQGGQIIGTLKHFPGLGDVIVDPHKGIPHLLRSKDQLEQIDWAPYRALIQQGNVHAIMVTHEILDAIDSTKPASLSKKIVQSILRDELGFQGVIMTDSLTMAGIVDTYTVGQAAALSIEAGSDMIMGASSPQEVGSMIEGIKQDMTSGAISEQRIDQSVYRILMMKYNMGLLALPKP